MPFYLALDSGYSLHYSIMHVYKELWINKHHNDSFMEKYNDDLLNYGTYPRARPLFHRYIEYLCDIFIITPFAISTLVYPILSSTCLKLM